VVEQAAPSQTATPDSQPSPTATPVDVLYSDDFEHTEKLTDDRWSRWTGEEVITDYHEGGYRINVRASDYMLWRYMDGPSNVTDVTLEVDAVEQLQSRLGQFGIVCRAKRTDEFYMFLVGADGYAQILKYNLRAPEAERAVLLATSEYSDVIAGPGTRNHIRADCVGTMLTLYVKGENLVTVDNAELGRGRVGLIVYAGLDGEADVLFDNFVVAKPRPALPQGKHITLVFQPCASRRMVSTKSRTVLS
jgi:hypothetical protein